MDYPNDYFWEMVATTKCKVILEADAHDISTMSRVPVNKALNLIKQ
jgi:hypothetical protein